GHQLFRRLFQPAPSPHLAPLLPPRQPRALRSAQLDDQRKKCLVYSRLLMRGLAYSSAAAGPDPRPRAPRPSFVQGGHVGLRPPQVGKIAVLREAEGSRAHSPAGGDPSRRILVLVE